MRIVAMQSRKRWTKFRWIGTLNSALGHKLGSWLKVTVIASTKINGFWQISLLKIHTHPVGISLYLILRNFNLQYEYVKSPYWKCVYFKSLVKKKSSFRIGASPDFFRIITEFKTNFFCWHRALTDVIFRCVTNIGRLIDFAPIDISNPQKP
jgi:hypothetical protein